MVLTLFLLWNGSVEPISMIMREFYTALTLLVGKYFPGEQMQSMMHVIDLVFQYRIDQLG